MRPTLIALAVCATLMLAAHGHALGEHLEQQAEPIAVTAAEALLQQWRSGRTGAATPPAPPPAGLAESDSLVFENVAFSGTYITPGPGFELSDDIQMIAGGLMSRFEFGYGEQSPLVDILCVFRANTATNAPGDIIAGPYLLHGVFGANTVLATLRTPRPLATRFWFGMAFSTPSAGPLLCGPAAIGTSGDTLYDVDRGRALTLPGVPSSFYLRVWVLKPVAVETTTWSAVKSLYSGH